MADTFDHGKLQLCASCAWQVWSCAWFNFAWIVCRCLQPERKYLVAVASQVTCTLTWPPYMSVLGVWKAGMAPLLKFLSLPCLMMVSPLTALHVQTCSISCHMALTFGHISCVCMPWEDTQLADKTLWRSKVPVVTSCYWLLPQWGWRCI